MWLTILSIALLVINLVLVCMALYVLTVFQNFLGHLRIYTGMDGDNGPQA